MTKHELYDKCIAFRDSHKTEYFTNLAKLIGYNSINDVFEAGYPINYIEKFNDEASRLTWENNPPKRFWRFLCRDLCNELLTELYGSPQNYFKTKAFIDRKVTKIGDTMEATYGYRNAGQSPEHIAAMKKGSNCKNPFASDSFKVRAYIRGKICRPGLEKEFAEYNEKVWKLTEKNRNLVPFTGNCYYTGIPIFRYDGNKKVNRNDYNVATLDHKISVLGGFMRGLPPEFISSVDNLCWCSKYFNSFKESKCEDEIRLSGMIERFKDMFEELSSNESTECNKVKE